MCGSQVYGPAFLNISLNNKMIKYLVLLALFYFFRL